MKLILLNIDWQIDLAFVTRAWETEGGEVIMRKVIQVRTHGGGLNWNKEPEVEA